MMSDNITTRGMIYAVWTACVLCLGTALHHVLESVPWDGRECFGTPLAFWQSPLYGAVFCAGGWLASVGLGALFWTLAAPVTGAEWSRPLVPVWRKLVIVSYGGGWILVLLSIPALPVLFAWTGAETHVRDFWHDTRNWCGRGFAAAALVLCLEVMMVRVMAGKKGGFVRVIGAVGLILFLPAFALMGVDWWLLPQPSGTRFSMTLLVFMANASVSALAAALCFPVAKHARLRRNLMWLLFSALAFKVYFSFSQYLVVIYGGLPSEVEFYALRGQEMSLWEGGEGDFVCTAILLAIILLRNRRNSLFWSRVLAVAVLAVSAGNFYWHVAPVMPGKGFTPAGRGLFVISLFVSLLMGGLFALGGRRRETDAEKK
ncbi:MAG: hypothetical protein LIO63_00845 [Akkermansia sp.]|nr:hypothetical protein [Akkermansia sp.]